MHRLFAEAPVAFPKKDLKKKKNKGEGNEEEMGRELSSSLPPSLPPYDTNSPLRRGEQITEFCHREHGVSKSFRITFTS